MPTVLRERGYRFFFYMADRLEPAHIHVERDDSAAKVWLDPLEFRLRKFFSVKVADAFSEGGYLCGFRFFTAS